MHRALAFLALAAALAAGPAAALTPQELAKVVATIDERQRNSGDWKALCYMEAKEKGKTDVVYELVVYRRDEDDKQMFLFTKPRAEAGKGYLRIDKNLWLYDPAVGRWERRTERERIGGTDTRRGDLDESRLVEEYDAKFEADEKLGVYGVHRILLVAKPGVDVAFPQVRLWVDQATLSVLKRQELALSGRLMRTAYYPRWKKVFSPSKGADVWYPEEMRLFDEIEKGNSTLILIKEIDLRPLAANLFTKAWLESKSR
ncbi:outer membrane lipoprotein-sorting protein [Anaeromyxobacter sp. SG64]|uniref:outer membrane lipoprotein-sorting protein n=1 Tax=Anaeromyxobacter sp. SG64 TaxID=2925409 RepID=UPI001F5627F3|nr:outer membrane lipoprotein-sorting protein [Anaeromyxobacter sp. SG64]